MLNNQDNEILQLETPARWWKVSPEDNLESSIGAEVVAQSLGSQFHVKIKVGAEYVGRKDLAIVMQFPGGSFVYSVANVFELGAAIPAEAKFLAVSARTNLRDMRIAPDSLAGVPVADQSFYLWPDPYKTDLPNNNAYIVSSEPEFGLPLTFNPDAYCSGGAVRASITPEWRATLDSHAQAVSATISVTSEIKKMEPTFKINFPSIPQSHCASPIATGSAARTAKSSDGMCMFMIVRDVGGSPYLAIFTKNFSDAVGFTQADMEKIVNDFGCNQ